MKIINVVDVIMGSMCVVGLGFVIAVSVKSSSITLEEHRKIVARAKRVSRICAVNPRTVRCQIRRQRERDEY